MQRVLGAEGLWILLKPPFVRLGTLWLMASEFGSPGHFVVLLIVLITLSFFFLNEEEWLLLFASKNCDYYTVLVISGCHNKTS